MSETQEVLRWVNLQRKKLGKRPIRNLRRGRCRDPRSCPVAMSIGGIKTDKGGVFARSWQASWDDRPHPLPRHVRQFILRFDDGEYPELVL